MLTLALETSGRLGAAALLDNDQIVAARELAATQRTAEALVPLIHDLLLELDRRAADLELIGVTVGPGSFTGLRIGVTLAKTLAYACGAAVVGVNSLEVIAVQTLLDAEHDACCCVMDAHRSQLFTGSYRRDSNGQVVEAQATRIETVDDWLGSLTAGICVAGPVLARLKDRLPTGCVVSPAASWAPRPQTVGQLARRRQLSGSTDDLWPLAPAYYRASAAEEKARK